MNEHVLTTDDEPIANALFALRKGAKEASLLV